MGFNILHTGASALTAAQRAVETAAHNAANSTTPGYTRQRVTTAANVAAQGADGVLGSGFRGTGVQVLSIARLRDVLGDLAVRAEETAAGAAKTRAEILDRAQGILGVYGSGVSESLSQMFSAFDQLALTPNSPAARQIVLEKAQHFTSGMNQAAEMLDRIRSDAELQAQSEKTEINDIATEIADLNKHIVSALNGGQQPNDLLDRRDVLIDRLSALAGARVRQQDDGSVTVSIGGAPLVQSGDAFPVDLKSESGTLRLVMHGKPVTVDGQLGARIEVLATDLRTIERQLNELASAVPGAINQTQAAGFTASGRGADFFANVGDARTLSLAISSGAEIAASGAGAPNYSDLNGENALTMADLRRKAVPLATGGTETATPAEWLNKVASTLASGASAALAAADTTEVSVTALRAQRETANGVSIDEEMVELVKFQHSYDAAARVISIADQMLDTLINGIGGGR